MNLTKEQLKRLATLLDEALDLGEDARSKWLEALDASHADLRTTLAEIFAGSSRATGEFLPALPELIAVRAGRERAEQGSDAQSSAVSATKSPTAGATVGPYRLVRELGRGGMGTVWLGERTDALVRRPVAIKLPHAPVHQPQMLERFSREREILATLAHPNIARLYDVGVADGQPYLAMEYVEGTPLLDYCDAKKLPVRDRTALFLQVLSAVQHAHSRLVVHRDLKPSNMLVTPAGEVRLLDFGIAKLLTNGDAAETELTQVGGRALTPQYASPEQITGQPVGTAADVYSLGVVLYQLLTGVVPYRLRRETRGALEEAILNADPKPPSQHVDDPARAAARSTLPSRLARALGGDLDTVVLKALKKQPAERYATAEAFAQDLQRYLAGRPVLARPDSAWYRTRKFILRNRLLVGAAAAVAAAALLLVLTATAATVVALSIGLALALWQGRRAREHARTAESEAQRAVAEAQTAEAVQRFMEDIFKANSINQPDPVKARQTTARELLDIAAQKIELAANDSPTAKLRILKVLADMYDDLGLFAEESLALAQKRVSLARATFGVTDIRTADALVDLATLLLNAGRLGEARQALADAGESIPELAHDSDLAIRGKYELRLAEHDFNEDPGQALAHADAAIALLRQRPISPELVDAFYWKANVCFAMGDYAAAKQAAAAAIESGQSLGPGANAIVATSYMSLGRAEAGLQQFSDAEQSLRHAVEAARRLEGVDGERTLYAETALGYLLLQTSRIKQALELFETASRAALSLAAAGTSTNSPSWALYGYAIALLSYGQTEQAVEVLDEVDRLRQGRETRPELLASLMERRGEALTEMGRYPEAQSLLAQAASARRQLGQVDRPLYNRGVLLRTRLLIASHRIDEAAAELEGFHTDPTNHDRASPDQLERQVMLAEVALATNVLAEAIALADDARARMANSASRECLSLWEQRAASVQGKGLRLLHRSGEALPLLQRAVDVGVDLYDTDRSAALADAQIALAECLIDLGRFDEAEPLAQRAKAIHATHAQLGEHYTQPLLALQTRLAMTPAMDERTAS